MPSNDANVHDHNEHWRYWGPTSGNLFQYSTIHLGQNGGSVSTFDRNLEEDVTSATGYGGPGPVVSDVSDRDAGGRLTRFRRRYLRDNAGYSFDTPNDQISTYTYRPDGRLAQLVNPDGTHDFTYDSRGLTATQVSGEGTYTYGYDELGRNSYLQFPDGHVRRQQYDEIGRLSSRCYEYSLGLVRCYTAQYDAVGNPVRMTDPDGADTIEYDALDRIKKLTREAGGATVAIEDYAYNALGALK